MNYVRKWGIPSLSEAELKDILNWLYDFNPELYDEYFDIKKEIESWSFADRLLPLFLIGSLVFTLKSYFLEKSWLEFTLGLVIMSFLALLFTLLIKYFRAQNAKLYNIIETGRTEMLEGLNRPHIQNNNIVNYAPYSNYIGTDISQNNLVTQDNSIHHSVVELGNQVNSECSAEVLVAFAQFRDAFEKGEDKSSLQKLWNIFISIAGGVVVSSKAAQEIQKWLELLS